VVVVGDGADGPFAYTYTYTYERSYVQRQAAAFTILSVVASLLPKHHVCVAPCLVGQLLCEPEPRQI